VAAGVSAETAVVVAAAVAAAANGSRELFDGLFLEIHAGRACGEPSFKR